MTIYNSYFDFVDHINKGHYFDLDMPAHTVRVFTVRQE